MQDHHYLTFIWFLSQDTGKDCITLLFKVLLKPLYFKIVITNLWSNCRTQTHIHTDIHTSTEWATSHHLSKHPPSFDQQYPELYAASALYMQDGRICHWSSVCGHLIDARRNEGWFFPKAPCRVQSHYRPCQIQLVTEFAAHERGDESRDGDGRGAAMKWISWWENSWGHLLIIKKKERAFLR